MTQLTIRIQFPFNQADRRYLDEITREDSPIAGRRIGPEGERQVRTASGEIYNLDSMPKFQARRLAHSDGHNPTPPASPAAIRAVA